MLIEIDLPNKLPVGNYFARGIVGEISNDVLLEVQDQFDSDDICLEYLLRFAGQRVFSVRDAATISITDLQPEACISVKPAIIKYLL